jgi:hypothetical protein
MPKVPNLFETAEIENCFQRIDALLACGIFEQGNSNPLLKSAFIDVVINLRNLMHKTEDFADKRIDFTDDINVQGKVTDVSSLIRYVRDAMCEPESPHHFLQPGNPTLSFAVVSGKDPNRGGNDAVLSNPYEDDVAFFLGSHRILLKRHIVRALEETRRILTPLIEQARALDQQAGGDMRAP